MSRISEATEKKKKDAAMKEEKAFSSGSPAGRGKRFAKPVPVTVSGRDKDGRSFKEDTRTIVITQQGILIETGRPLALGAEVSVENAALGHTSVGQVVWSATEPSSPHVHQVGISVPDVEELCGVKLSPENGDGEPAAKTDGKKAAESPAANPVVSEGAICPSCNAKLGEGAKFCEECGAAIGVEGQAERSAEPVPAEERETDTVLVSTSDPNRARLAPDLPPIQASDNGQSQKPAASPATAAIPSPASGEAQEALDAALASFERRIQERLDAQTKTFEDNLSAIAKQVFLRTRMGLDGSAARLRENMVVSFEEQLRPLGDRLQSSSAELESLLGKVEKAEEGTERSLQECAVRLRSSFEQQLAPLTDRLQASQIQLEGMVSKLENRHQQIQATLDESAARLRENMVVAFEQELAPLTDRLQASQAQVEGMTSKLDDRHRQIQAGLDESASHLKRKMLEGFEEQFRPIEKRVLDVYTDIESMLARAEELRCSAREDLAETAARVRESLVADVEQQLRPFTERIQNSHAEVEALLPRLEDLRQLCQTESDRASEVILEASQQAVQRAQEATERLESLSQKMESQAATLAEALQAQSAETSSRLMEDLQKNLEGLVRGLQERFMRSAQVFEETTLEAVRANAQKVAQEFLETSAAQLQQAAQDHLRQISEQLDEHQKHAIDEALESLKKSTGEVVEASAVRLEKLADQNLHLALDQVAQKQKAFDETEQVFRDKISEILRVFEGSSAKKTAR